tara:strand:+ start:870 stop:1451 length:582 start_codon:yes stop_codon:yes gene_type:complete
MIRKWIRKIVNKEVNTTMKEMFDAAVEEHYDDIMEKATEKIANNYVLDMQDIVEHLDVGASDLADEIDLYDMAYHMDLSALASEFDISDIANAVDTSDVADRIDIDNVASYVLEGIDVDYQEVADNMVMAELAQEIDVNMLAALLCSSDEFAEKIPNAMQKALAKHDAKITNMLHQLVDSLYNIVEERREVEE